MRRCVHAIVCLVVGVGLASCKKKASETRNEPAPAADARLADQVPKVETAEALVPASVALPTVIARIAADGTVSGAPPPPPPPPEPIDAGQLSESAQLARAKAIEEARNPHAPGRLDFKAVIGDPYPKGERFMGSSNPTRPAPGVTAEVPQRQGKAVGESLDEPLPAPLPQLLVAAHPAAKATALVDLLAVHPALVAVAHQGNVRALRVGFVTRADAPWDKEWLPWVEVRMTGDGVVVEGVPGTPVVLNGALDAKALAEAWKAQLDPISLPDRVDVDVLVDDSVDVQRLVDVLAALDLGGARVFALGRLPPADSDEMKKRGKDITLVQVQGVVFVGGLERSVIEDALVAATPAVKACFEKAQPAKPSLIGTVRVQFFISPNGAVAQSSGSGVNAETAACIAKAVRGIEFPNPSGGGGAQVNASFVMRT